ncbi:phosphatase PAP2 family protein [Antarcticibacterium flavum]|uniref:Phosphatase PAP2 family protein n=2 Tax=Antarcticibacterium TaxID=2058174 RepID=A0A5B7X1D8_9FLAO|nr:phosphatase PAP2 family protein [Antarcticibacterium flavum]MCM4161263.1 hypothetical protein [Antarcticibacterium sp. W02-3]QCY68421.1 phosphatase PAP2 family protein [Antarcticibacterium flavum]
MRKNKRKYWLIYWIFIFLNLITFSTTAQTVKDTTIAKPFGGKRVLQKMIVPATLILGGSILSGKDFEKEFQTDVRGAVGENYEFKFGDYARYVPIVQMYTADALGVKSKNHWFDQTKNLALAIVVTDFITFRLKNWIPKKRPGQVTESFPSAHTSFAFANAGVLYQEFKDTSPFLAYSGFGIAAATGAFRVINNTHWISDVIVGAGIGILVTNLIYLFDPIIKWNPFLKKKNSFVFIPRFDQDQYGLYLTMKY